MKCIEEHTFRSESNDATLPTMSKPLVYSVSIKSTIFLLLSLTKSESALTNSSITLSRSIFHLASLFCILGFKFYLKASVHARPSIS